MKAFFADIKETGLVPDRGNEAWGSQLALPTAEQQQPPGRTRSRNSPLPASASAAQMKTPRRRAAPSGRSNCWRDYEAGELAWHYQRPLSAESANGAMLTIYNDEPVDYTNYDGSNARRRAQARQWPGRRQRPESR